MVKISILMAVYNTAQYLPQSLDSLLAQTMEDFQVICVDDASTDDSLQILKSYASRDSRIQVIPLKENHGQAYARNKGLECVTGTYTCFLDSDDWLGNDALQQVVDAFGQDKTIDSVLFRCRYYYSEDRIEEHSMPAFEAKNKKASFSEVSSSEASVDGQPIALSGEQAFELSLTWKIHGVYAVKTSIHQKFPYDDSALAYSDDNTTHLHYLASRKVVACGGEYFYRQHVASVTHQVSSRRFDYLKANFSMRRHLLSLRVSPRLLQLYENERWKNIVGVYLFYWQHVHELSDTDREYGLSLIRFYSKTINFKLIYPENKYKLGFLPCRYSFLSDETCWRLFRLQANFYFTLKKMLGKL